MRKFFLLVLIVLCSLSSQASGHEVAQTIIFNTGPFPCDGTPIVTEWKNTNPYTMYFYSSRVFHGRDYGVIADYHTEVRRGDFNGSILALFQNDAYDMGGHREQETGFRGHYQSLPPNESLWMLTFCRQYFGTGGNGQTVVTMTWAGQHNGD